MDSKQVALLTIVLLLYLAIGGGIFMFTEGGQQEHSIDKIKHIFTKFLDNHTCVGPDDIDGFVQDLLGVGGQYLRFASIRNIHNNHTNIWDFPGSFTFSVQVVTTIGYGQIHPSTTLGRILCMVYAMVGIPLTLVVLAGIGEQLSKLPQKFPKCQIKPDSPNLNKWINAIAVVAAGVCVMFIIPSVVFTGVEDWSILDSVYYCFITLSTIGFGDYVAGGASDKIIGTDAQNIYRIAVYLWIIVGLAYLSLIIKSMSIILMAKAQKVQEKTLKRVNLQHLSKLGTTIANTAVETAKGNSTNRTASTKNGGSGGGDFFGPTSKQVLKGAITLDEDNNVSLVKVTSLNTDQSLTRY